MIAPPGLPPVPVKKGEHVFWSDYVMARMPSIWGEDCAEFNPQRWIETPGPGAGGKGARPTLKNYGPWKVRSLLLSFFLFPSFPHPPFRPTSTN